MGLDSVELVMEVENFFGIAIPDRVAEKMVTVQDMVAGVAILLGIADNSVQLKEDVFVRVNQTLQQLNLASIPLSFEDYIFTYLDPGDKAVCHSVEATLGLNIFYPFIEEKMLLSKLKVWTPQYHWKTITVGQFIDALCVHNHTLLIPSGIPKNTYELYILLLRLISDKTGVDYYEIAPEKSFTNDLGID